VTVSEAALRARPQFRRYVAARVVSIAGTLLTAVVLPVLIYRLTESVAWTAAVAVALALPHVLLGLLSGWLQRRSVVLGADLAGAAVLASIPVVWLAGASSPWLAGASSPWHVVAVAFVSQALFVVSDVAEDGALTTLVGDDEAEAGRAAVSGSTTLVQLMVPLLIGLAVVVAAPELLLALAAAGAVVSAVLVRSVPRQPPPPRSRRAGTLRFLGGDPAARTLTLVGTAHATAGGAFAAVLLPWADVELGVPPEGDARLALVVSCWVIGGLIAAGITPLLRRSLDPVRLSIEALLASLAAGLIVLATTYWLPAVLFATIWGTAYWTVVCTATEHHRAKAPAELRSKVDGTARALTHGLGFPAGAVLAGAVAGAAGPRAGLAAGLAVLALGIALAWLPLRAAVRRQERVRR
jgi:hypothetical protein